MRRIGILLAFLALTIPFALAQESAYKPTDEEQLELDYLQTKALLAQDEIKLANSPCQANVDAAQRAFSVDLAALQDGGKKVKTAHKDWGDNVIFHPEFSKDGKVPPFSDKPKEQPKKAGK